MTHAPRAIDGDRVAAHERVARIPEVEIGDFLLQPSYGSPSRFRQGWEGYKPRPVSGRDRGRQSAPRLASRWRACAPVSFEERTVRRVANYQKRMVGIMRNL